jgi:site-specific DNA-methyltransferase (cytosine-N4-specific)
MTAIRLDWQPYRLLPYERRLGCREVTACLGAPASADETSLHLNGVTDLAALRNLTYFSAAHLADGTILRPKQAILEATARNGRQSTRYSAHGLHEYRGKFNPQVVRAIGNIMGLRAGDWLLDPFCGSGTSLLEAAHSGWNALGLDANPLAIEIASAKLAAIRAPARLLDGPAQAIACALSKNVRSLDFALAWSDREMRRVGGPDWPSLVPNLDYLQRWFPRPVLAQLAAILRAIDDNCPVRVRSVFRVLISDILREVSWQDPGDLRIRRRREPAANYPAIPLFLKSLQAKIPRIAAARKALGAPTGSQQAVLADSAAMLENIPHRFDAAITSPPYVTALPYIDTQRLSLCVLGLITPDEIPARDRALIGSREITVPSRRATEELLIDDQVLPQTIRDLCAVLLARSATPGNGFRRRNVPALTYRYFLQMASVFDSIRGALKPGGSFSLIVGENRTRLGGRELVIPTPRLLGDLAVSRGWDMAELEPLDTYRRFDVHSRNSIRSESLLTVRAAGGHTHIDVRACDRRGTPRTRASRAHLARSA